MAFILEMDIYYVEIKAAVYLGVYLGIQCLKPDVPHADK